ncbi:MAG: hypothetical protein MUE60_04525 [Candidatus Eisenbacteria bacterium]|nr:hypothetical protein [Candidatus Eisenbacteria bacterium]
MAKSMPELERLLAALTAASKVTKYYPPGHPQIEETLGKVLSLIAALVSKGSPLTLAVQDDGLYVGPSRVLRFEPTEMLFRNLRDLGVKELAINPGVTEDELLQFVELIGRDPKKIWEEGGLPRTLRQRRITHVGITTSDFAAAERQASMDSLRAVNPEERAETITRARDWFAGSTPPPPDSEILRIVALIHDSGGIRDILDSPGPAGHSAHTLSVLIRLWGAMVRSGLEVSPVEGALAADLFATDPRTLLEVAGTDQSGTPHLHRLVERLDPRAVGDLIAARVGNPTGDAAAWIPVIDALVRASGPRRAMLYRVLQGVRSSQGAADAVALFEEELSSGAREESAFLSLLQGSRSQTDHSPASWSGRWGSGVLVRRATGVLERVGLSDVQRVGWLSSELDRLIEARDAEGVIEVLEVARDRRSTKETGQDQPPVVSPGARVGFPAFLMATELAPRARTIQALVVVDRSWREILGRLLDSATPVEFRQLVGELEGAGIVVRDLVLDLMRSENSDDIARGIRLGGTLGGADELPILLAFLDHGNPAIRIEAISTLARVAPHDLTVRLPGLLRDLNPLVSVKALDVAGELPDVVSALTAAVRDGLLRVLSEDMALAVVGFVSRCGTPEQIIEFADAATPRLIGKPLPPAVREAVKVLGPIEKPRGMRRLFSPRKGDGCGDE